MPLPSSGPISTAQIRAEIGGSGAVTIPSSEVRTLTGVASGPVVLATDFHGKNGSGSSYSATAAPSTATGEANSGTATSNSVTCAVAGGTGPFTYAWSVVSGGSGITINSPTSATTTFSGDPSDGSTLDGVFRCQVTDTGAGSATTNSNNVSVTLSDPF